MYPVCVYSSYNIILMEIGRLYNLYAGQPSFQLVQCLQVATNNLTTLISTRHCGQPLKMRTLKCNKQQGLDFDIQFM